jgi:Trk-type K+ transport system membrane component
MNKKGLTWTTLVTAIIAIIVLILIVYIFKDQIKNIADQFMNVIKQTGVSSEGFTEDIKNLKP